MGKKSTAIAVIAIICGASGLGFGIFTMLNFQTQLNSRSGVVHSWYVQRTSSFEPSSSAYVQIPDISLTIDVNTGEDVYILFIADARITQTQAEIKICINNIDQIYTEIDSSTTSENIKINIALQYVKDNISPGTYLVNVWVREETGTLLQISVSTLLVQTFIP